MRTIRRLAARLVALWRAADRATRTAGAGWYRNARRIAREMARRHGVSLATAAGVIAALSPRLMWVRNVLVADMVCAQELRVPGVFAASLAKARAIRAGAKPTLVLRGPKVRAFYRALMGDEQATVVDVWTARAAGLRGDALTDKQYADVSAALHLGAKEVRTTASRLQAVAWVAIRGRAD
jgi:hypothetical protein